MMTGEVLEAGHAVRVAERLEQDNPDWLVLYGSYTREFVAFPVYPDAPDNCYCSAKDPAALDGHIRETERRTGHVRLMPGEGRAARRHLRAVTPARALAPAGAPRPGLRPRA